MWRNAPMPKIAADSLEAKAQAERHREIRRMLGKRDREWALRQRMIRLVEQLRLLVGEEEFRALRDDLVQLSRKPER